MSDKNGITEYVFKEREVGDSRKWEDIPELSRMSYFAHEDAKAKARELAEALARFPLVVEIRYNESGSLQGHYTSGSQENMDRHKQVGHWRTVYEVATTRADQDKALQMLARLMV